MKKSIKYYFITFVFLIFTHSLWALPIDTVPPVINLTTCIKDEMVQKLKVCYETGDFSNLSENISDQVLFRLGNDSTAFDFVEKSQNVCADITDFFKKVPYKEFEIFSRILSREITLLVLTSFNDGTQDLIIHTLFYCNSVGRIYLIQIY